MKKILILSVLIHFIVAGWHGVTHQSVPVPLNTMQTVFVLIVVMALPIIGAVMVYTRHQFLGATIIFVSMLASLIFGVLHHYILISPDNIKYVPHVASHGAFVSSALFVVLSEATGTVCGAVAMKHLK